MGVNPDEGWPFIALSDRMPSVPVAYSGSK